MKKLFIVAAIAAVVCSGWFAAETHWGIRRHAGC